MQPRSAKSAVQKCNMCEPFDKSLVQQCYHSSTHSSVFYLQHCCPCLVVDTDRGALVDHVVISCIKLAECAASADTTKLQK